MAEAEKSRNRLLFPAALFAVYAVLTFIGALRHEIWFDEAQAWCIVRDNSLAGIFEQLRYEGHPALWYLLLLPFTRLGFPCGVMPFISWAISLAAAAVLLFRAPFGNVIKAAAVFSGGFLFWNSVISRSYCITELTMFLIAYIYPERKKRPVLLGVLVALLANTHICVCGLVGILGIYMLADFITDMKAGEKNQIMLDIAGLFIAGTGVIAMVLPLLGSLGSNMHTAKHSYSLSSLTGLFDVFPNAVLKAVFSYRGGGFLPLLAANTASIALIAFIILIAGRKRPVIMLAVSIFFYALTTEIIWFQIENRAYIFLYFFVFAFWLYSGSGEKTEKREIAPREFSVPLLKFIYEFAVKCFQNPEKTCGAIIAAILFMTVPCASSELFYDYFSDFSASKTPAEYIRKNIGSGAVFITHCDQISQVAAYLPADEYKFYCMEHNEFLSYKPMKEPPSVLDHERIASDLGGYDKLYFMCVTAPNSEIGYKAEPLYSEYSSSQFCAGYGRVLIYDFSPDRQEIFENAYE